MNNKTITLTLLLSIVFITLNVQADSWFGGTLEGVGKTTESAGKTVGNFFSLGAVKRAEKEQKERNNSRDNRNNNHTRKYKEEKRKYQEEGNGDEQDYEND